MIRDADPVLQAFLGCLFTWAVTALGACMVIFIRGSQVSTWNRQRNFRQITELKFQFEEKIS
jgi:hypothetical protein